MNRIIKFRAWNKKENKWQHKEACDILGEMVLLGGWMSAVSIKDLNEIVVLQYTGIRDKNGIEIFEGDIVVQDCYVWFDEGKPNYRGTVEWIYSQWQVVAHCINSEKRGISSGINEGLNDAGFDENTNSDWIVVGNIFDNPEMILKQPIWYCIDCGHTWSHDDSACPECGALNFERR